MKTLIKVIAASSLFIYANLNFLSAQECKYKINDVSAKKMIKQTVPDKLVSTLTIKDSFSFKQVDTSYFLIMDFEKDNGSNDFPVINIEKGAQLILFFEHNDKITLSATVDFKGKKAVKPVDFNNDYICDLSNIAYNISKSQLETIHKSKLIKVRFYHNEGDIKGKFYDYDIKEKCQELLKNKIKCILNNNKNNGTNKRT